MTAVREEREVFSLAASAAAGEKPRPGFLGCDFDRYRALPASSVQIALGLFGEVRRDRVGVVCYGDEITLTSNDREKFATYMRDSYTGMDDANQRDYVAAYGRFGRPDPAVSQLPTLLMGQTQQGAGSQVLAMGQADPKDPRTWNRYGYAAGDPVNRADPSGANEEDCEDDDDYPSCLLPVADQTQQLNEYWTWELAQIQADLAAAAAARQAAAQVQGPQCFAQLKDRPVNDTIASVFDAYHSFWWVQQSSGAQEIISAGPQNGYLNVFQISGQASGADNVSDATVWSSGVSNGVCAEVSTLVATASAYPENTVTYVPYPGPNSNSAAYYLGYSAGFFSSPGSPSVPSVLYGWGITPVPITGPGKSGTP